MSLFSQEELQSMYDRAQAKEAAKMRERAGSFVYAQRTPEQWETRAAQKTRAEIRESDRRTLLEVVQEFPDATVAELSEASGRSASWVRKHLRAAGIVLAKVHSKGSDTMKLINTNNAALEQAEKVEPRTDSNTYFQIFKLEERYTDWWPQHLRDLNACGIWGAMQDESGDGFAWILNWPEKFNAEGNQVTPWGAAPERHSGKGIPETDAELFRLLREHDVPALAPESLVLDVLLLHAGVRIIDPPQRTFPYYRGQP